MANNYNEDINLMSPYKEINEKLENLVGTLYMGGKRKTNNERPMLVSLPNFFKPRVTADIYTDVSTNLNQKMIRETFTQIHTKHKKPYSKALVNSVLDKSSHLFFTMLAHGLTFSTSESFHTKFINSDLDLKTLSYEAYNIGLAGTESLILFSKMTKDMDYSDPKCKDIANKVYDLFENRIENCAKGIQTYGPFNSTPVNRDEFIDYYKSSFKTETFENYIEEEKAKLNNPNCYMDVTTKNEPEKNM